MAMGPQTSMPYWVRRRIFQRELGLSDFSGGLNLRDAALEIANNESPDLLNVTLDERGGIQKRLGFVKKNAAPYTTAFPPQYQFEWKSGGHVFTQCGPSLFIDDTPAAVHVFSTGDRCGMAEFNSAVYVIHPADGLYKSTDGSTWSLVANGPKGVCLEPWQNRLVAGGDPSAGDTLYASGIGDGTDWLTSAGHGWTNEIREHDQTAIVAIHGASGVDIAGRPGLLVFKNNSAYRVYDSNSGAYQTLDVNVGAASSIAVTSLFSETFVIHQTGIYQTNGLGPLELASAKLQPLFTGDEISYSNLGLYCAGAVGDRVHFSLPSVNSAANDIHLEYQPAQGWIVAHDDAASCYLTYSHNVQRLYGGSPTVAGQVYRMGYGGSDDGNPITARYQTKWLAPNGGIDTRFRRLRVIGRGTFSVYVKVDFDPGVGTLNQTVLSGSGFVWGTDKWGAGVWGPGKQQDHQDFWSLGKGQYISLVVTETSKLEFFSAARQGLIGPSPQGAFALYGLLLQFIPISI